MQFNQCGPFPQWNYGPFNGFIPPQQPCNPTPEVVGEGDVVSTVNLDGSMQFYFVPVLSYPCGFRSMTAPCANPCGAWLIKSISNPITAMNLYGPTSLRCPAMSIPQIQSKFIPDINANPSYQLKFHNDGCSSTSDLHYFYPNLRACEWIPPVPYMPPEPPKPQFTCPEPPKPQFTCPEECQERPNIDPPPCERMCVDPQTSNRKQETEKPISYPGLCFSTSKEKRDTGTTKEKGVLTSASKSSCSLRSLLNKIKCKRNKRNGNTKRNDSSKCKTNCCSHCECTRQTTKRKKEEKTNPSPSTSTGSFLNWSKKKKKNKDTEELNNATSSNKKKDTDKPGPSTQVDTSQDSCPSLCQTKKEEEDKVEKSITPSESKEKKARNSSSNKSLLQSLFDKIKSSVSSLYSTPSKCNQKKQTNVEPAKSSTSDEKKKKKEATPKPSGMSLKGILAKVCYKCKKKEDKTTDGPTHDKLKKTRSVSSVHVLYDRGSKDLQNKTSQRSESINPSPAVSRISQASPHHCGCDKCLRCTCAQKALDCQCSKYEIIDKHNANHCTCHESKQSAKYCKCDKVTEEDTMDLCICKEDQTHQNSREDTGKKSKTLNIASECNCNENQKKDRKCYKASSENPCPCGSGRNKTLCENRCKSKSHIEKKRSNLRTSKLAQSANGDKKKRTRYVCGCVEDNKDETNCDDQCKYKSSLKEVIENKRQADCTCILCKSTVKASGKCGTEKGNTNQNKFNCGCDRDSGKMECDSNCKNKCKKVSLQQQLADDDELAEDIIMEPDDPPIRGSEKIISNEDNTNLSKYVCAKDPDDEKACDENKRKNKVTLRLGLSESEAEDSIMVIEPSDSRLLWDSESFLLTSGSSEYCSCRPGRCKYKGTAGDSACSFDSEVE